MEQLAAPMHMIDPSFVPHFIRYIPFHIGMYGVSVNTESTDTFNTDTDAQRTPMTSTSLVTEAPTSPTLTSLEHR